MGIPLCNVWVIQILHVLARFSVQYFLISSILIGACWYHTAVLTHISLMVNDVEKSFNVLTRHLYLLFSKISLLVLFHFPIELLDVFLLSSESSLYVLELVLCKSFLQVYSLSFHPHRRVFCREKKRSFYIEIYFLSFMDCLLVSILRTLWLAQNIKGFILFFLKSV